MSERARPAEDTAWHIYLTMWWDSFHADDRAVRYAARFATITCHAAAIFGIWAAVWMVRNWPR